MADLPVLNSSSRLPRRMSCFLPSALTSVIVVLVSASRRPLTVKPALVLAT
jgi:hypothetical protein